MKKLLKTLFAALLVFAASCSDEKIEPEALPDDLTTHANLYQDKFLTLEITTNFDNDITFYLYGNGGQVSVDWGDGASEDRIVGEDYVRLEHRYPENCNEDYECEEQDYTIRVSGDIKTITEMDLFYEDFYINSIHLGGLTNLKSLSMGVLSRGPAVINLARNKSIERVTLPGIQMLQDLILPSTNQIISVDISGYNMLSTSVVDRIIARVHDSVINSPRTGHFTFPALWAQEEGDLSVVGPPSRYSYTKLRKLRDKYGWRLFPEIQ